MRFSETLFARAFFALLLFVGGLLCGNCWGSIARAQSNEPITIAGGLEEDDRAYALALAQVAVNEEGTTTERGIVLVHQAASYHGATSAERLAWLRCHSRKVLRGCARRLPPRRCLPGRNCQWTRNLGWNNDRPEGFPERARWRASAWERVRLYALEVARGNGPQTVCSVPIVSWGGRADFAGNSDVVSVECGTRNLGATTPAILERARARRAGSTSGPLARVTDTR